MDVVSIRHMARLTEWRQRILACRTSGMPVTAWCAENHISAKTYYRWERLCLAEVSWDENTTAQVSGVTRSSESEPAGQLVKIDPHQLRDAAEQCKNSQMQDRITLRYGNLSVEMPCGTPVEQLTALMKALASEC